MKRSLCCVLIFTGVIACKPRTMKDNASDVMSASDSYAYFDLPESIQAAFQKIDGERYAVGKTTKYDDGIAVGESVGAQVGGHASSGAGIGSASGHSIGGQVGSAASVGGASGHSIGGQVGGAASVGSASGHSVGGQVGSVGGIGSASGRLVGGFASAALFNPLKRSVGRDDSAQDLDKRSGKVNLTERDGSEECHVKASFTQKDNQRESLVYIKCRLGSDAYRIQEKFDGKNRLELKSTQVQLNAKNEIQAVLYKGNIFYPASPSAKLAHPEAMEEKLLENSNLMSTKSITREELILK